MKKVFLLIIIFIINLTASSQDYIISSGCYSDLYQYSINHDRYYLYGRFDISFPDFDRFNDGGREMLNSIKFDLQYTSYFKTFYLNDSYYGENCPSDTDYDNSNEMGKGTATFSIRLLKDDILIDEIIPELDIIMDQNVSTQIQNAISNWEIPDNLEFGDGYQLEFELKREALSDYYDPFNVDVFMYSGIFTLGNPSVFTFPINNDVVNDLTPKFTWEERNNAEYKIVIGLADNPPIFNYNNSTNTYTISNAIFQSEFISDTNFTIPDSNSLNQNTNYSATLITRFDDSEYRSSIVFSTRDYSVVNNDIDFYTQVTPNSENPSNYLNQGIPIRFKVKVLNELSENLSSLSGTISCSTPGVTINDDAVSFSSMQAGDLAWSNDEFEIIVDPSVANGTNLEFELSLNDPFISSGPWISYFSFPIAPLQTGEVVLVDNEGDNDGIPEPGEDNILIQPKIDNISNSIIEDVRGILTSDDNFLYITQNNFLYNVVNQIPEPINPGDTDIIPAFPYEFSYPETEALQELNFNLELQGTLNDTDGTLLKWQTKFSFNDGIEPPPSIVSTIPEDNAIDVATDTELIINFSTEVTTVDNKSIFIYENDDLKYTIPVTENEISINGSQVSINLSENLQAGSNYFIIIDEGAFIDNAGQIFEGISNPSTWNFTTMLDDPPQAPVLTANVISDSEIELSWNSVEEADSYTVMSCDENTIYVSNLLETSYTVTNLTESTTYNFIVKAENSAGLSPASNCESATTFCATPWKNNDITTYGDGLVTAYGIVTINGEPADDGDVVSAFVGDELRSIANVVEGDDGNTYVSLVMENNGTETYSFKIWDQSNCIILPVSFTVEANPSDVIGLPEYLPIAASSIDAVENNLSSKVSIYPNPANNKIYISINDDLKINEINLYSISEKKLIKINKQVDIVSINSLAKGIYFMHLITDKGVIIKKIIKK